MSLDVAGQINTAAAFAVDGNTGAALICSQSIALPLIIQNKSFLKVNFAASSINTYALTDSISFFGITYTSLGNDLRCFFKNDFRTTCTIDPIRRAAAALRMYGNSFIYCNLTAGISTDTHRRTFSTGRFYSRCSLKLNIAVTEAADTCSAASTGNFYNGITADLRQSTIRRYPAIIIAVDTYNVPGIRNGFDLRIFHNLNLTAVPAPKSCHCTAITFTSNLYSSVHLYFSAAKALHASDFSAAADYINSRQTSYINQTAAAGSKKSIPIVTCGFDVDLQPLLRRQR